MQGLAAIASNSMQAGVINGSSKAFMKSVGVLISYIFLWALVES